MFVLFRFAYPRRALPLLALAPALALAVPAAAQETGPAPGARLDGCRQAGLTVTSQTRGDIPQGGPVALASWREIDRDVTLEDHMATQLATLGYTVDDNAFWRLVYETDSQAARTDRNFSIYSEIQGGKEPTAQGRYSFERGGEGCPPTSVYRMTLTVEDTGGREVWRGEATQVTLSTSPAADKDRLSTRLLNQLQADARLAPGAPADPE